MAWKFFRRLKNLYPDIQVIVLTGHGTDKDEEEVKRFGGFGFLKKPADIETLERKIRKAYQEKDWKSLTTAFAEDTTN